MNTFWAILNGLKEYFIMLFWILIAVAVLRGVMVMGVKVKNFLEEKLRG